MAPGARNIKPARDRIERRVVLAIRKVFGIFIRGFSARAAYNQYSAPQHSRNAKLSGFDISRGDSFLGYRQTSYTVRESHPHRFLCGEAPAFHNLPRTQA